VTEELVPDVGENVKHEENGKEQAGTSRNDVEYFSDQIPGMIF
jgi:hypothetical protein